MDANAVWKNVCLVRESAPLIHNITNFVVMNSTANALLSAGASPIMAHAPEEMAEMVAIVGGLVLNIGTLSSPWIESMLLAGELACKRGIPVVLDPVGAGATSMRTDTALRLMHKAVPSVLRGNGSEIMAINGAGGMTRGVDSMLDGTDAVDAAMVVARQYGCVVAVTGAQDVVTDGTQTYGITGGSPLMARVTGMGCTASALVGAHVSALAAQGGVENFALLGTVCALCVMATAGGMAAESAAGPGSFQMQFLDALYTMTLQDVEAQVEVALL